MQGRYYEAETLLHRALVILEQQPESYLSGTAVFLDNAAFFYDVPDKYDQAEPLYQRAWLS